MKSIVYKQCCHRIEINPCLSICNGTIERRFTRGPLFTRQSGSALYVCVKWLRTGASRTWPLQSTQLSLYRATTYYWSPGKSVCTTPPPPTILLTSTVQWRVSLLEQWVHTKGGLKSESAGGFSIAIINIPFYYLKLLNPLHGSDKMSIIKKIYLYIFNLFTGSRSRF